MSRVGKSPVTIAKGVDVKMGDDNVLLVKGPKGELKQWIDPCISFSMEDGEISLSRGSDHKDHRSKHGLYRALIANMIEGVTNGYTIKLELVGVGYRAKSQGQRLELSLGFSHPIIFEIPSEVTILAESVKGKNPAITLTCFDKQLIGQVASKIRSLRKPEPYKGKGVRYVGEYIRKKDGKTAAK
ncbi:MAG: large subunit ribosomal protein L6 [Litorivivens sp.]|jgi:large subunit ribosomal protein L6